MPLESNQVDEDLEVKLCHILYHVPVRVNNTFGSSVGSVSDDFYQIPIVFDPDWNPTNDKQDAVRVSRDGWKKRVCIYTFFSTGTIEEKVYQRQMSKEGLQKVIQQEQSGSKIQVVRNMENKK